MKIRLTFIALLSIGIVSDELIANDWQFDVAISEMKKSLDNDNSGWHTQKNSDLILNQERYSGVLINAKKTNWPITLVIDLFGSSDKLNIQGSEEIASITEANVGFRKYFGSNNNVWSPYAGAGLSFLSTKVSNKFRGVKISQRDTDSGYWIGCGINWNFSEHWYTGLDIRYSTGTLKVFDQTRKVDGLMTGLTFGLVF